jgi:cell wall-associated NlpC family hydrolase
LSDGRKYLSRAFATICIVPVTGTALALSAAAPAAAAPDVDHMSTKVHALSGAAHHAAQRYHRARVDARQAHHRLESLRTQLAQREKALEAFRAQVASSVVVSSQGDDVTLTSEPPSPATSVGLADRLSTVTQFDDRQTELLTAYAQQVQHLQARQHVTVREVSHAVAHADRARVLKLRTARRAAAAAKLLDELKERAAARASRSAERTPAGGITPVAGAVSGRAATAVAYALAQVGKAYVYGAAGPSAFDCSGLTMRAWAQAGVSLPHSSSAQTGSGRSVSQSQLQPGDLVFYYSPVSHVGMYIGNGQIVNAENPGVGVKITGVNSMPYAGAVRPG